MRWRGLQLLRHGACRCITESVSDMQPVQCLAPTVAFPVKQYHHYTLAGTHFLSTLGQEAELAWMAVNTPRWYINKWSPISVLIRLMKRNFADMHNALEQSKKGTGWCPTPWKSRGRLIISLLWDNWARGVCPSVMHGQHNAKPTVTFPTPKHYHLAGLTILPTEGRRLSWLEWLVIWLGLGPNYHVTYPTLLTR